MYCRENIITHHKRKEGVASHNSHSISDT